MPLANTNLLVPVVVSFQLLSGSGYSNGSPGNAGVLIYPSVTPTGSGLIGLYYTNSSTNYLSVTNLQSDQSFPDTDGCDAVDFNWTTNLTPNLSNGVYSVR